MNNSNYLKVRNQMFCFKGKHTVNKLYTVVKAIGRFNKQCLSCSHSSLREQDKSEKLIKNQSTRQRAMQMEKPLCFLR